MRKTCKNSKRQIEETEMFCKFCAVYAVHFEADTAKSFFTLKNIIISAVSLLLIIGAILTVFVFDVFEIFGKEQEKPILGTGEKLFSQSLTPVKLGEKWGYADKSGKIIIAPKFSAAYPFAEEINGYALVAENGKYGYIDETGEYQISPVYSTATQFSLSGLAAVSGENRAYNAVDGYGREMFPDVRLSYVGSFNEKGYAIGYLAQDEYYYLYYPFDSQYPVERKTDASDTISKDYPHKYYILKSDGKAAEIPDSKAVFELSGEYFTSVYYTDTENTMNAQKVYAVYSCDTLKKLTEDYNRIYYSNSYILLCRKAENGFYSVKITDRQFNTVNEEYYTDDLFTAFDSGFVLYEKSADEYTRVLLDDEFNTVIGEDNNTEIISGFDKSGIACVKRNGKYCGYTKNGNSFETESPFGEFNCGLAPLVEKSGKVGYINTRGKIIITPQYDSGTSFYADGFAYAENDNSYSIIDTNGKQILTDLQANSELSFFSEKDTKTYCYSNFFDGELLIDEGVIKVSADSVTLGYYSTLPYRFFSIDGQAVIPQNDYRKEYIVASDFNNYGFAEVLFTDNYTAALIDKNGEIIFKQEAVLADSALQFPVFFESGYISHKNGSIYDYENNMSVSTLIINPEISTDGSIISRGITSYIMDNNYQPLYYCGENYEIEDVRNGLAILRKTKVSGVAKVYYYLVNIYTGELVLGQKNTLSFVNGSLIKETEIKETDAKYTSEDVTAYYYNKNGELLYKGDENLNEYTPYILHKENGKYFFVSENGDISGGYEYAVPFTKDGYAVIKENGRYICVDEKFNKIFDTDTEIKPLSGGLAPYFDNESALIGFLDDSGKVKIPAKYKCVGDFTNDGYCVVTENQGDFYVIDKNGNTVFGKHHFGGKAVRKIGDNTYHSQHTFKGYADFLLISDIKDAEGMFPFGLTTCRTYGNNSNVSSFNDDYYDEYGNKIVIGDSIVANGEFMCLPDGNIVAPVYIKETGKYGVCDIKGNLLISDCEEKIEYTSHGHFLSLSKSGVQMYTADGKQISSTIGLEYIRTLSDGYYGCKNIEEGHIFFDENMNVTAEGLKFDYLFDKGNYYVMSDYDYKDIPTRLWDKKKRDYVLYAENGISVYGNTVIAVNDSFCRYDIYGDESGELKLLYTYNRSADTTFRNATLGGNYYYFCEEYKTYPLTYKSTIINLNTGEFYETDMSVASVRRVYDYPMKNDGVGIFETLSGEKYYIKPDMTVQKADNADLKLADEVYNAESIDVYSEYVNGYKATRDSAVNLLGAVKYGFVREDGYVIDCKFKEVTGFSTDGYALGTDEDKNHVIVDNNGNVVCLHCNGEKYQLRQQLGHKFIYMLSNQGVWFNNIK